MLKISLIIDDGGRAAAGFRGHTGDCAARAAAIATGLPYKQIYEAINLIAMNERPRKRARPSNARTGVHTWTLNTLLEMHGFKWTPTMTVGSGCKVHLRADELPSGIIITRLSKHYAAVIDGVLHDTHDSSRDGTRCVYGYWSKESSTV